MTPREQQSALTTYRGILYHAIGRLKSILSHEDYEELESDCQYAILRAVDDYDARHDSGSSEMTLVRRYVEMEISRFVRESGQEGRMFEAGTISLTTPIGPGDAVLEDAIESDDDYRDERLQLDMAIGGIVDARRRDIVSRWRGGQTCADIGREYGVSRERARQIRNKGVEEMGLSVGRRK